MRQMYHHFVLVVSVELRVFKKITVFLKTFQILSTQEQMGTCEGKVGWCV